jgi:hypothetical protein
MYWLYYQKRSKKHMLFELKAQAMAQNFHVFVWEFYLDYFAYFEKKNTTRRMGPPFCLCVSEFPTIWMSERIFMKPLYV